jgi:Ubiquitin-conjugating enzyme
VRVQPVGELRPPDTYHVSFRLRGLELRGDQPVALDRHEVEIRLPVNYPREKPLCVPLTPIFHPNVKTQYCLQDHWAAGQTLVDIITKIGDIIQYRAYNVKSPLNAVAARWTRENPSVFPLGNVELNVPQVDIVFGAREKPPLRVAQTKKTVQHDAGGVRYIGDANIAIPSIPREEEFAVTLRAG